jgi:negative regulator of sigma-B (phosphoserine phosphatase)
MENLSAQLVDYGVASAALSGESQSGDEYLVQSFADGVLVAVVDGLGHGGEAAEAARIAVQTLRENASESVIALARRCHKDLQRSRGVVMSLARFDATDSCMTWMGVGNVGGLLIHAGDSADNELRDREVLLMRSGVVGSALPALRASVISILKGDTLILATDGVSENFSDGITVTDPAQKIADRILSNHNKGTDDALVLVVHFLAESI